MCVFLVSICGVWGLCISVSSCFSQMARQSRQEMSRIPAAVRMMFRGNHRRRGTTEPECACVRVCDTLCRLLTMHGQNGNFSVFSSEIQCNFMSL